jgi:hypothetical protein
LTAALAQEFESLDLGVHVVPVETLLHGAIDDQAALHGVLRRIEALGLELVEVRRIVVDAHTDGEPPSAVAGAEVS